MTCPVSRLNTIIRMIWGQMISKTTFNNFFKNFWHKRQVWYRPVVFHNVLVQAWFFQKRPYNSTLKEAGTEHSLNDVFTMLVMTDTRLSRHDFNNDVGRGSSSQDLLGAFSMIFRISSIEAAVKAVKGWPPNGTPLVSAKLFLEQRNKMKVKYSTK